jgi:hypothetical protein
MHLTINKYAAISMITHELNLGSLLLLVSSREESICARLRREAAALKHAETQAVRSEQLQLETEALSLV